ncbi:MAG: hypothetical protein GX323_02900 [Clostridiales bacterium]|nr:hypothetical protein [Clostridiales bacterium]
MPDYFDIHSHILPGLDDGAKTADDTRQMLYKAYESGIRNIIATPHFREERFTSSVSKNMAAYERVKELIEEEGLDINLYLGNELYYSSNISNLLLNNEVLTMAGSDYVLIEFSPSTPYQNIKSGLQNIIMSGYWPILAHFERYDNIVSNRGRIEEIYNMGVCIQINASTITGPIFNKRTKLAKKLLKYNMVDFIATDSHNSDSRSPDLSNCIAYISKKYGNNLLNKLLYVNPSKIINNEEL